MLAENLQTRDSKVAEDQAPSTLDSFSVLGVSYRTAALDLRKHLAFSSEKIGEIQDKLSAAGISGSLVLCTCNRTEIYFSGSYPEIVFQALCENSGIQPDELHLHSYLMRGEAAAAHLFRVASGLDSAALGETEILAQFKEALRIAGGGGHVFGALNLLFQRALNVSKRVRTETELSRNVTSIASMAVRQASIAADGLSGKKILVVGAGAMGERLIKDIAKIPEVDVVILNRSCDRAATLAAPYGFQHDGLDALDDWLGNASVVFCAVSVEKPIISSETLRFLPITVVDLGVPGAVEELGGTSLAQVIDIESVASACAANSDLRTEAVAEAESIISYEVSAFAKECAERDVAPAITALVSLGEHVRDEQLRWALSQLDDLRADQKKVVEDLAFRMMRGMLHGQIAAMKSDSLSLQEKTCLANVFRDMCPEGARD